MSTIFNKDKQEAQPENNPVSPTGDTPVTNPFNDLLGSIKNESGEPKYNSVESALEALKHSQEYIPTLKDEKNSMSQELESLRKQQSKIDDLTAIVEKLTAPKSETPNPEPTPTSEQDVAKLVQSFLEQKEATTTRESNTSSVTAALAEKFGTEAEATFYGKAKELGMTKESFNELAATSPKAVLSFFGGVTQNPSITKGSQGVDHFFTKPAPTGKVERGEQSVMAGATSKDLKAEMARHREAVYAKHGITQH